MARSTTAADLAALVQEQVQKAVLSQDMERVQALSDMVAKCPFAFGRQTDEKARASHVDWAPFEAHLRGRIAEAVQAAQLSEARGLAELVDAFYDAQEPAQEKMVRAPRTVAQCFAYIVGLVRDAEATGDKGLEFWTSGALENNDAAEHYAAYRGWDLLQGESYPSQHQWFLLHEDLALAEHPESEDEEAEEAEAALAEELSSLSFQSL